MRSALAIVLLAAACGSGKPAVTAAPPSPPPVTPAPTPAPTPAVVEEPLEAPTKPVKNTTLAAIGLDASVLDRTADPCEDFYQFACGGWQKTAEIDADLPIAMRSFVDIEKRNEGYLHDILDKAKADPGKDAIAKQVGAYYGSCMDEATIAKVGLAPIQGLLAEAKGLKDLKALSSFVAKLQSMAMNPLFGFGPTQDFADATQMIGSLDQAGLGLPDRDYYLTDNAKNKELRTAYHDYLAALLVEAGQKADAASKAADEILGLETEIAKVHKDKVAMRDPKGIYNRIERAGVEKAMPHFVWAPFFKAIGQNKMTAITASAPEFLAGLDAILVKTPMPVWRNYFTARVLQSSTAFLPKKFEDLEFAFSSKLSGSTEQRARWKRCVGHTDNALGEALGQLFVKDHFPGESKAAAEQQVHAIVEAMNKNIDTLPWMDAATKIKAHEKANAMAFHIGYPATWKTYTFKIDSKTWGANVLGARKFSAAREYAKIGKPVDRNEWGMTPPTVNAYYDPTNNKMVFPAGILQTPFYQLDHSLAVNLGAMGMVVGHELTHGFDDQGSQFDAKGNLANWWQPETEKAFKQRTQCVIDQYSQYPAGGGKLNGQLTVGENIADIGGIKLALAAYRALRASAPDTDIADGFTEDQQFFLSFGQTWCAKSRPEYEAMLVTVDPHSPPRWRVNGTMAATPEFAKAFRCKAAAKMRPANACVVW